MIAKPARALPLFFLLLLAGGACSRPEQAEAPPEEAQLPTTLTPQDTGWPRQLAADGIPVTFYQPQVESWVRYSRITFKAAVSFTPEGAGKPIFGALRVRADTDTDLEERSVLLGNMEVIGTKFLTIGEEESAAWTARLGDVLPRQPIPLALDRLLAYFEHADAELVADDLDGEATADEHDRSQLVHDAPRIYVSQEPAILVLLDGDPVLYPIDGTELLFAVNTNWDLFFHASSGRYYLLDMGDPADGEEEPTEAPAGRATWLAATALDGPWTAADELPPDFLRLGDDWQEVVKRLPGGGASLVSESIPAVYATTEPAELIVIDGAPALTPIEDTRLLWVQNTDADLFLYGGDGSYYFLVSGRWFRAATFDGPWQHATGELPADFGRIPADHPRGSVLASVPGSPQAAEAVRLAKVPTKATVQRTEATAEVDYHGDPEFAPIEGTEMHYATNTQSDVIMVGDLYYLCLQGVWFVSSSAIGPWQVTDSVAQEIYTIPPASPVHHTTYVEVYDSGPDWVTVGYTAAYLGLMIAIFDDPVVVYGTGWHYPPYVRYGPRPIYHPYPHSYGAAAWYNPHTGTYGRGAAAYGPYGGAGRAAAYNPRTGTYARGVSAWGPYGGTSAYRAYNPRTGGSRAGYRSATPYASWGEGVARRGDQWAHGAYYSDSRGTVAGVRTSEGDRAVRVRSDDGQRGFIGSKDGDVYVGCDGEVYKRGDDGWSKRQDGGWNDIEHQARAQARSANAQTTAEQRRQAENARSGQARTADPAASASRDAARSRASAATGNAQRPAATQGGVSTRAATAGGTPAWSGSSSREDVLRQLDRDARARVEGSSRAQDFQSRRSGSAQSRSRAAGGRSRRGGRRGG